MLASRRQPSSQNQPLGSRIERLAESHRRFEAAIDASGICFLYQLPDEDPSETAVLSSTAWFISFSIRVLEVIKIDSTTLQGGWKQAPEASLKLMMAEDSFLGWTQR
jgi:hypothetical protein